MREQELKLEKVKKSCKTAKKVVGVFKILLMVVSAICFVSAAVVFGLRNTIDTGIAKEVAARGQDAVFTATDIDINLGIAYYQTDFQDLIDNGQYSEAIITVLVMAGVVVLMFVVVFILIQKIFKIMDEEETPFCESVLKRIKRIFIALAIIIALEIGLGFGIILGLVFWCIYNILDYGYALQKEVDEIL